MSSLMSSREEREDEIEVDEETTLLKGADFEILGTSSAEKEGNVFVWCATEGVKLFDVEGRRCLLSLPPPKARLGMVGVDRSHDLGCVFGVTEENEVCCWELSLEKKQDSRPKSKLRKTVPLGKERARTVALLSSPDSPLLFLVSRNGEISAFNSATSKIQQIDSPPNPKIEVLSATLISSDQTKDEVTVTIFFVFQVSKSQIAAGAVSLLLTDNGTTSQVLSRAHSSFVHPPSSSPSPASSPSASTPNLQEKPKKPSALASFSSFTVNQEDEEVSVCWSNGYLQLFTYRMIRDSFSIREKVSLQIACYDQPGSSAPQPTKRKRKAASVASVSPPSSSPLFSFQLNRSFLAVFGQSKKNYILTIWETAHGTLSSSRTVSFSSSSSPLFVSFHKKSDFLSISFSNSVLVVPVSVPKKSLLSAVIGKAHTTLPYLASESQGRFLEAPLSSNVRMNSAIGKKDGLAFDNFNRVLKKREQEEKKVIQLLTDRSATPTAEEFSKVFSQYAESILIRGKRREKVKKPVKTTITPKTNMQDVYRVEMQTKAHNMTVVRGMNDDAAFSFNFLQQVMGRCLQECSEQNLGFWGPIKTLVKSHYVYARHFPQLLPLILKQKEIAILCDCLLFIHDIPEVRLVSIIQFVLNNQFGDDVFVSESGEKATEEQRREIVLNLCIRKAVNAEFLRPALTLLKEVEVALLFSFLKDRITGESSLRDDLDQEKVFRIKNKVPGLNVVLEWVMALLDSQLSTILFSETCSSVLLDLSLIIREQVAVSKELNTIAGQLWNVMNRKERTQQRRGAYTIEKIYL